jgi:hypothetical protein
MTSPDFCSAYLQVELDRLGKVHRLLVRLSAVPVQESSLWFQKLLACFCSCIKTNVRW